MKVSAQDTRRKAVRLPVETEAIVHLIDHQASSKGKYPLVQGTIQNISVSGVLLDLPVLLWPETKIRIQFRLNGREYDRYCSIIRSDPPEEGNYMCAHGIRFMPKALALVRPSVIPMVGRYHRPDEPEHVEPPPTFRHSKTFGTSIHVER